MKACAGKNKIEKEKRVTVIHDAQCCFVVPDTSMNAMSRQGKNSTVDTVTTQSLSFFHCY